MAPHAPPGSDAPEDSLNSHGRAVVFGVRISLLIFVEKEQNVRLKYQPNEVALPQV